MKGPLIFELYRNIVKYYPIGLNSDREWKNSFMGLKRLNHIYTEKYNFEVYKEWKSLLSLITNENSNCDLIDTDLKEHYPSFGAELIFERIEQNGFLITKSIFFSISLIGEYYTIFGRERIFKDDKPRFHPNIVISPIEEFKELFEYILSQLSGQFPQYNLVPYLVLIEELSGYSSKIAVENGFNVYNALFTPENINAYKIIGKKSQINKFWYSN